MLSFKDDLADIFKAGDLMTHAIPVGMRECGDLLPVPLELINAKHFVYDLVYTPFDIAPTTLVKEIGARAVNGLSMLLYQAAA